MLTPFNKKISFVHNNFNNNQLIKHTNINNNNILKKSYLNNNNLFNKNSLKNNDNINRNIYNIDQPHVNSQLNVQTSSNISKISQNNIIVTNHINLNNCNSNINNRNYNLSYKLDNASQHINAIFDPQYYKQCQFDHEHYSQMQIHQSYLTKSLLSVESLYKLFQNRIVQFENSDNFRQRYYKTALTKYLVIDMLTIENHFIEVQLILSLNKSIPILIKNPSVILYNDHIFKCVGHNNRYECEMCKKVIIMLNKNDKCLYLNSSQKHLSSCNPVNTKRKFVFQIIKLEMKQLIHDNEFNQKDIITRNTYTEIVNKYKAKIPLLNMLKFPSYKTIRDPLKHFNILDYFEHGGFDKTLSDLYTSPYIRFTIKNDIVYKIQNGSIITSSIKQIELFCKSLAGLADGTFDTVPQYKDEKGRKKEQTQVYKMYGAHKFITKENMPIVRCYLCFVCLLNGSDQTTYEFVFNTLLEWINKLGIKCNIHQFICDYETSQRNAWEKIFPSITITGDEFHFSQAIQKYVRNACSFRKYYDRKLDSEYYLPNFHLLISMFFALCHIPSIHVQLFAINICIDLIQYVKIHMNTQLSNALQLCNYILYQWCEYDKKDICNILKLNEKEVKIMNTIKKSTKKYAISGWNIYKQLIRTNNAVEGRNRHDKKASGYFPTINKFMKWTFNMMDITLQNYNTDISKPYVIKSYVKPGLLKKNDYLKTNAHKITNYKQFKIFSDELANIRYRTKHGMITNKDEKLPNIFTIDDDNRFSHDIDIIEENRKKLNNKRKNKQCNNELPPLKRSKRTSVLEIYEYRNKTGFKPYAETILSAQESEGIAFANQQNEFNRSRTSMKEKYEYKHCSTTHKQPTQSKNTINQQKQSNKKKKKRKKCKAKRKNKKSKSKSSKSQAKSKY